MPDVEPDTPRRLTYLVKHLQEALRVRLAEITQRFGLTPTQYAALTILARHPGMSSAALARVTFVSPQAANEMVATLARKGLLVRSVDEHNRRRLDVALTPAGAAALAGCDAQVDSLEGEVFAGVSPGEQQQFKHMLQACVRALAPGDGHA